VSRIAADSSVFHAIADPTRRAILDLLRDEILAGKEEERRTVMVMLERIGKTIAGLSQSAFSQHLRVLLDAGLVSVEKKGRSRIYSIRAKPLAEVSDWITTYDAFWSEKFDNLHTYLASHNVRPRKTT
jgi:DNA-binding transcriptional ArsR family regulator